MPYYDILLKQHGTHNAGYDIPYYSLICQIKVMYCFKI